MIASRLAALGAGLAVALLAPLAAQPSPPGGAAPRLLDGRSTSAFRASMRRVNAALAPKDQERLTAALGLLRHMSPSADAVMQRLHGTSAAQVIALGDALRRQVDDNRDGIVTETELAAARADLQTASIEAGEAAAVALLRLLHEAQTRAAASAAVDRNDDGVGEFGYFGDLVATEPPLLPPAAFAVRGGVVAARGYYLQTWLPTATRAAVSEADSGGPGSTTPDPDASAAAWCGYAWPIERGRSGTRAFFINQEGTVLVTDNEQQRYGGERAPEPYAAYPLGTRALGPTARGDRLRNDGGTWVPVAGG
ncbi:MAG: hypothetical protein AAF628_04600 [Planctomycetota bacterium]